MSVRTLVVPRTASGRSALPVGQVREVRPAVGLRAVPLPHAGVVGPQEPRVGRAVLGDGDLSHGCTLKDPP